ncbi:MAG: glycoside hydrolase family protein [Bacteroidetes bacterium]|nr:glycoside hydrolase family protein [Bacteroidota bacterium]
MSSIDRRLIFGFQPTWASSISSPPPDYDVLMVAKMAAAHVQSARCSLNWDVIEPNPPVGGQHTYLWSTFDAQTDLLVSYGIEPIETIVGTPWWAKYINKTGTATGGGTTYLDDARGGLGNNTYGGGSYEIQITAGTGAGQARFIDTNTDTRVVIRGTWDTPPDASSTYRIAGHAAFIMPEDTQSNRDAFAAFCQAAAGRYQGKVRYYEFWNEPDLAPTILFDVNEYAKWLGRACNSIKQGNANALLAIGGLTRSDMGYLRGVYSYIAGQGQDPDQYFDALALHPYTYAPYNPPMNFTMVQDYYDELVNHENGDKTVWLTEYGGFDIGNVSEQQQSDLLLQCLQWMDSPVRHHVAVATYHLFADQPGLPRGVCTSDLTERVAYATFRDFASPRTPRSEVRGPAVSSA